MDAGLVDGSALEVELVEPKPEKKTKGKFNYTYYACRGLQVHQATAIGSSCSYERTHRLRYNSDARVSLKQSSMQVSGVSLPVLLGWFAVVFACLLH